MNHERNLAAWLMFILDKELADSQEPISKEEIEKYHDSARRLYGACTDIFMHLPYVDNTETDIQYYLYEVGKTWFGVSKVELNYWFKCFYALYFSNEVGPRLGVFVKLFGMDEFLDRLEVRLNDPFELKGVYNFNAT